MPRTATTALHRTMATDTSRWNTFDLADMVKPLPPISRSDHKSRAKLVKKVRRAVVNPIDLFYPGWFECLETMNSQVIDEADEDLGLYNSGLGILYQDTLLHLQPKKNIEAMALESAEMATYRYAWLDMIMRIYQKLEPDNNKTWLMKDPKHTAFLPQLIQQFPDARFVFIHRVPGDILASMAKLFMCFSCVSVNLKAPGIKSADWGQYTLKKASFFLNGIVEYSKRYPMDEDKRIDFAFSELTADLTGSIERIYDMCFNQKPSRQAKTIMQSYIEKQRVEKKEAQTRQLKDFHLTEEDVIFDEYRKIFL